MKDLAIVLSILGAILLLMLILNRRISPPNYFESVVSTYYSDDFKGQVINKFIDRSQHNFRKLEIQEKSQKRIIKWDFEGDHVFNFINVGDSLIKKPNSLYYNLKRKDLDTLLQFKFDNLKGYESHQKFLDELN